MTLESANHKLRKIPFFRFLDFSLTELNEMQTTATMPFAGRLVGNPVMEYYHGGIIASFMEGVAAISVANSRDWQLPKPITLTVDYRQPAVKGPLIAKATITRKGWRVATVRTVCWQDSIAQPVADGQYHFLMV